MAKKHKNLDEAAKSAKDDLLKECKAAMKEAIKSAAKQAEIDIMAKAKTCLEEYYDNFDPNRYDRTETLQYAFLPYSKIKFEDDSVRGSVGVEYSADVLAQFIDKPVYHMGKDGIPKMTHVGYWGSNNYQPVDTWWVLDNYLRGVHPITNGATTSEDAVYFEIRDDESPNKKMRKFIKEYEKTFDTNVLIELLARILKK